MNKEVIARPYAQALFQITQGHSNEAEIAEDLGRVLGIWEGDKEFSEFIRRPEISRQVKHDAVNRIFQDCHAVTRHLLGVVIDKQREDVLATIYEEYRNLWDSYRGIMHAEVTTKDELSEEQQKSLADALSRATGQVVQLTLKEDPGILAGVVVRIGDRVLDGSLARRLAILGERLRQGDGGGSVVEH